MELEKSSKFSRLHRSGLTFFCGSDGWAGWVFMALSCQSFGETIVDIGKYYKKGSGSQTLQ